MVDIVESDVVLSPPEESDHDDVSIQVEEEGQEVVAFILHVLSNSSCCLYNM